MGAHHVARWSTYYDMGVTPTLVVDGTLLYEGFNAASLNEAYNNRVAQAAPCAIDLTAYVDGDELIADVVVSTEDVIIGDNHTLRIALLTGYIYWDGAAIDDWYSDLLEFVPDPDGFTVDLDQNDTETFTVTHDWPIEFNGEDLVQENVKVVAFVQNDLTQSVAQAAVVQMTPLYDFDAWQGGNTTHLVDPGETSTYTIGLINLGILDDVLDITVNTDGLPDGWSIMYTTPDGEQTGNSTIALDPLGEYTSTVSLIPGDVANENGEFSITVTSQGDPENTFEFSFFAQTSAQEQVLIVNGDPEGLYSEYFTSAINAAIETDDLVSYGIWEETPHPLNMDDLLLSDIEMVIWYLGDGGELDTTVTNGLVDYLNMGGNLFMSGSDMAHELWATQLMNMMGASYESYYNDEDNTHVYSLGDDPVTGDLEFDLVGGDGADNLRVPCYIDEFGNGVTCMKYADNIRRAAIRNEGENYRTFLTGFPFEAIATAEDRTALMRGVLDYMTTWDYDGVDDDLAGNSLPEKYQLHQNYPNPFNPSTEISLSLPANSRIILTIFDITGREVARLADGAYQAGHHNFTWNADNSASGVYFYRLSATGESQSFAETRKMLLLK